jgi:hypothetical protein
MSIPRKQLWPYDEVSLSRDALSPGLFTVSTPWIKCKLDVGPEHGARVLALASKISEATLQAEDLPEIQWFFQSLAGYPLSYILPRGESFGTDDHSLAGEFLESSTPLELLRALVTKPQFQDNIKRFSKRTTDWKWTWDHEAALTFSLTPNGYDPETLFSVARRFHLLNDLEWNKTGEMLEYVRNLKSDPKAFQKSSALIVRQNHYITEQCDSVLRAALPISQKAYGEVTEFIQAETGHDKILGKAIKSIGAETQEVPTIDTTILLMEVFREVAKRNFLAFALVVDIFERSSYRKEDPLANLLRAGGLETAAKQADIHRDINDSGGHENVALGFLVDMTPVSEDYAIEALSLAELATLTIHQLSAETLDVLRG